MSENYKPPFGSIEELMEVVGYTREVAERIWSNWHIQPETDPEKKRIADNKAKRYEVELEMLNYRLSIGEITHDQFHELEYQIYESINGS